MPTEPSTIPSYRVLIPVSDNEDSARAQTDFVSSLPNGPQRVEATLTHVLHGEELDTPRQLRQTQRVGTVAHARKTLRERGIDVQVMDSSDPYPPTESILTLADTIDADLIVLGGGTHTLIEDLLSGNVAKSVGRRSPRPLTVVPDPAA